MSNADEFEQNKKVLVIGGSGFYGRYLVNDFLQHTSADITIASRNPMTSEWRDADRVHLTKCDIYDLTALEQLVRFFDVVVHCGGPFQKLPLNPVRAAIAARVNYVDISEDRVFHNEVTKMGRAIKESGITVLSGMSVAPAMEILFAGLMQNCFDSLISVRTFAAPDTHKHRGKAMFHTMLSGVGRSFFQPKNGVLRKVWGWTEPEWVEFPPPLGKRLTHLVLEMADLDLLPELYDVKTVEFKAGTEWTFLNRLLGLAAGIRKLTGYPKWENFTPIIRLFSWIVGRFGKDEGGVIFELGGISKGVFITHQVAVIARQDGGLIPSVLASIGVKKLISKKMPVNGIVPLNKWISSEELVRELVSRDLEIWWKPHDIKQWLLFDFNDYQRYIVRKS